MKPVFPDARFPSKLFPPNGPFAPQRCAICNGRFEIGQQFYNYGQGQVVHTKCRFQKDSKATQRKPLTNDEMWSLWNSQGNDAMNQQEAIAFSRAIEAAHGIR